MVGLILKTSPVMQLPKLIPLALLAAGLGMGAAPAFAQAAPRVLTEFPTYVVGEPIQTIYSGGPGNATDWIGIYPEDIVPGSVGSTLWQYTVGGAGALTFADGLATAGAWDAHLLLNDGYDIAASTRFRVVETWEPLLRPSKPIFTPGEPIEIAFTNGMGTAKDWIGVYPAGQTPGVGGGSTLWLYTDGTEEGDAAPLNGAVSFPSGLEQPGEYVAYYLLTDGYDVYMTAPFWVEGEQITAPTVQDLRPSDGATHVPTDVDFYARIVNGTTSVVVESIVLELNGGVVPAQITEDTANNQVLVEFLLDPPAAHSSVHTYRLSFSDNAEEPAETVLEGSLTIVPEPSTSLPRIITEFPIYVIGETIVTYFFDGPANPKDWVGIYPEEVVPGTVGSTRWFYTDLAGGNTGVARGTVPFGGGLNAAGLWDAHLLLNDGYDIAASTQFRVVDTWEPLLRPNKPIFAPGEPITIAFTNGWGMAKDWIGIYPVGQTPGDVDSTLWSYIDGTTAGTGTPVMGEIVFEDGLTAVGEYVAYYLLDDGYNALVSAPFFVEIPSTTGPQLLGLRPVNGAMNVPPDLDFFARITNGTSSAVLDSIALRLNGEVVPVNVTPAADNSEVVVSYQLDTLAPPGSSHSYVFSFQDDATPPQTYERSATFNIAEYRSIHLPEPIYFEDFDDTPEGELPAGWTSVSFNEPMNFDLDLGSLDSLSYAHWVVVEVDRFNEPFVLYSNPDNSAAVYTRVLSSNPLNVVNNQVIRGPLAQNRFLFANSGYRSDASQVLELTTPDFDLSGQTDVHVSFHSLWEQNQDSIAVCEYSIDQGITWLPVSYFIDGPDVLTITDEVTGETVIDVDSTFFTEYGDVAMYTDPVTFLLVGGRYADFVKAPITQDLAPFIHGRVDDNPIESKRVELFRLPAADGQSTVRFRFLHAGTDSWYWGIDNFGLYSIPEGSGEVPVLHIEIMEDNTLRITWDGSASGWVLESSEQVSGGTWTPVTVGNDESLSLQGDGDERYFRFRRL